MLVTLPAADGIIVINNKTICLFLKAAFFDGLPVNSDCIFLYLKIIENVNLSCISGKPLLSQSKFGYISPTYI